MKFILLLVVLVDFDIILIVVFFRNICGFFVLVIGWNIFLFVLDKIEVVDIICIKIYRNEVYVYVKCVFVDEV